MCGTRDHYSCPAEAQGVYPCLYVCVCVYTGVCMSVSVCDTDRPVNPVCETPRRLCLLPWQPSSSQRVVGRERVLTESGPLPKT